MFHELTDKDIRRRRNRKIAVAALVVALAAAAFGIFSAVHANAREQGAVALRDSVLAAAKQCCAIEGSYPSSFEYLEQKYGLTINEDDYVVSYEWFAGNVMPSVVVTPR